MEIRHEIERSPEAVFDFLVDTDSFHVVDRALVLYEPGGLMHVGFRGSFVPVRHALASGDGALARGMVRRHWLGVIHAGELDTVDAGWPASPTRSCGRTPS